VPYITAEPVVTAHPVADADRFVLMGVRYAQRRESNT
jgi:hypothetical protein